jgi:hypothetical protein
MLVFSAGYIGYGCRKAQQDRSAQHNRSYAPAEGAAELTKDAALAVSHVWWWVPIPYRF